MAEKIQTIDIRLPKDKRNLASEIPLSTPYALFIETSGVCNFQCKFCPTGIASLRKDRPNGIMKFESFCKLVDDIKRFPKKIKRVNLYLNGEELINKDFTKMVRYMKDADVAETIWLKTNGSLLNPDLNSELVSCGLDWIGISVEHVHPEGYKKIAGYDMDFENFTKNLSDLYAKAKGKVEIFIKIVDTGLTEEEKERFYFIFSPLCDKISIEQLHNWSSNVGVDFKLGKETQTFEGYDLVDKEVCPLPFYMLAIGWNLDVLPCNEDFLHHNVVGNVANSSLVDIWNGGSLKNFRKMMLSCEKDTNKMCKDCDYIRTLPDNLDPYRKQIYERIFQQ